MAMVPLLLTMMLSLSSAGDVNLTRTTIVVADREASLAFYRDTLGFTVIYEGPYSGTTFHGLFGLDPGTPVYFLILQSSNHRGAMLGLLEIQGLEIPAKGHSDAQKPRYGETILWFTTENLSRDHQRVQATNATIVAPPFDTQGGREMVVEDPDGVRLYLFEKTNPKATP